uniref:Sialic acid binding Ig-like lectin H n=1 Tax=Mus musculus TaxID=10090 RepID=D6RFU8_MOUSE
MLLSRLLPLLWVLKWASGNCFILPREVIDWKKEAKHGISVRKGSLCM